MNSGDNNFGVYLFEELGVVKGFVASGDSRDEDSGDGTAEIQALYIDPAFQREKIGTKLIRYSTELAEKRGQKEIVVWVFEKNPGALRFYEKNGFSKSGKTTTLEPFNERIVRLEMRL